MLLLDFGSTYTKGVVIDIETPRIVGRAQCPTRSIENPSEILRDLVRKLEGGQGINPNLLEVKYASSSAAGGLRIVAIGLVPDLTLKAAQQVILGAGGKVVGAYAHKLNKAHVHEIEAEEPNIVLLTGGTDGGEEKTILHNARLLAKSSVHSIFLVAGNNCVAEVVGDILQDGGKSVIATENVMKDVGVLNIEPARTAIRQIFLHHIAYGVNDRSYQGLIDGVIMPTPSAVLNATKLLHDIFQEDVGGVMVIDIGGATTDVHSVYKELLDRTSNIVSKGLPEPFEKRTVEGDLGVRHSIESLVNAKGDESILDLADLPHDRLDILHSIIKRWSKEISSLSMNSEEEAIDLALARAAAEIAIPLPLLGIFQLGSK